MSSDVKRKLAAIMFTDIAGYTALSSKDENRALELLDKQEQILTPIIEEFNGTSPANLSDHCVAGTNFKVTFTYEI